jgi:hypothetical protein
MFIRSLCLSLISLPFLIAGPAAAQVQPVQVHPSGGTCLFSLHNPAYRRNPDFQHFINILADALQKDIGATDYSCSYTTVATSDENNDGTFRLRLHIHRDTCYGDVIYKDFDMAEQLSPAHVSFDLMIFSGEQDTVRQHVDRLAIAEDGDGNATVTVPWLHEKTIATVELQHMIFGYDEAGVQAFDDKIQQINDYYVSSVVADSVMRMIERTPVSRPGALPLTFIHYLQADQIITRLNTKHFIADLDLTHKDPAGYLRRLGILNYRQSLFRQELLTSLNHLPDHSIACDHATLAAEYTGYFIHFFELSKINGYLSGTNYFGFGRVSFTNAMLADYSVFLAAAGSKLHDDISVRYPVNLLSHAYLQSVFHQADSLLGQESFAEAQDLLAGASSLIRLLPCPACTGALSRRQSAAVYGLYDFYLTLARRATNAGMPELAGDYLAQAAALQHDNPQFIVTDAAVHSSRAALHDTLLMLTGWPLIQEKLSTARMHVWGNEPDKSRRIYNECLNLMHAYDLTDDTVTIAAMRQLDSLINDRTCRNTAVTCRQMIAEALQSIQRQHYLAAAATLRQVMNLTHENEGCDLQIEADSAAIIADEYAPAIEFMTMLKNLQDDMVTGDCKKAAERYKTIEAFYNDSHVAAFGIDLPAFNDMLQAYAGNPMILCYAAFLIAEDDLTGALAILMLLKERGCDPLLTADIQRKLGAAMARKDHAADPSAAHGDKVNDYIHGNKWLDAFRKAYLKSWGR